MLEFDFKSYLAGIDPGNTYTTTSLSQGSEKLTVRASRQPKEDEEEQRDVEQNSKFKENESVVMKYAVSGEKSRSSGFDRQMIESFALRVLEHALDLESAHPSVRVPKTLHHDLDPAVLCTTDLGPSLATVSTVIREHHDSRQLPAWKKIGGNVGSFLADFHSAETMSKITNVDVKAFKEGERRDELFERDVKPWLGNLQDVEGVDADGVYDVVKTEFSKETEEDTKGKSFVIGDFTTKSLLMFKEPPEGTADEKFTGIHGFEYANVVSVADAFAMDMSRLLADMALLEMSCRDVGEESAADVAKEFISGFGEGYKTQAIDGGVKWIVKRESGEVEFDVAILRKGYLALGREMVNMAAAGEWKCTCCGDDVSKEDKKRKCKLVNKMKKAGVLYLQMVGKDVKEFSKNWDQICEKDTIFSGLVGGGKDGKRPGLFGL